MLGLTRRQLDLLNYLRSCELCPSFVEMRDALGLTSKSGIHRLVDALEERGYVRRIPGRARSLEIVRLPLSSDLPPIPQAKRAYSEVVMIPLHGRIS